MICGTCAQENQPNAKFCLECGAPIARSCPACGSPQPPTTKFCGECGMALTPGLAAPRASVAPVSAVVPRRALGVVLLAGVIGLSAASATPTREPTTVGSGPAIYRVIAPSAAQLAWLQENTDLLERRDGDDYFVLVSRGGEAQLVRRGLRLELEEGLPAAAWSGTGRGRHRFAGGYRTVDSHYRHLRRVAARHPELARVLDYGDSWLAVNGRGGRDLLAICITERQRGDCRRRSSDSKPRAIVIGGTHPREIQPPELAWRFIDLLVAGFGHDAGITNLLRTTEVWVIPIVNPDGHDIVALGGDSPYFQRKNANDSNGQCAFPPRDDNHFGVDLNRNADHLWGGVGSSGQPCDIFYRGVAPASEPEEHHLEDLLADLWDDQQDRAPGQRRGTFVTLHSYAGTVILPPGAGGYAPEDGQLRALAFRMSYFNRYRAGTGPEVLYASTGSVNDWLYGTRGIAAFNIELEGDTPGCTGFMPPYSCIDSELWPDNRDALLYAARVADRPYVAPLGPSTTVRIAGPDNSRRARAILTVDDNTLGDTPGSFGRPIPQVITGARLRLATVAGETIATYRLQPVDGALDETIETFRLGLDLRALAPGRYLFIAQGRNATRAWGPPAVTFHEVLDP
jgi:hypothetical protein